MPLLLFGLLPVPTDVEREIDVIRSEFMRVNVGRSAMGWRGPNQWELLHVTILPIALWLLQEAIRRRAVERGR